MSSARRAVGKQKKGSLQSKTEDLADVFRIDVWNQNWVLLIEIYTLLHLSVFFKKGNKLFGNNFIYFARRNIGLLK